MTFVSVAKSITSEFIHIPLMIIWAFLAYWMYMNIPRYLRIIFGVMCGVLGILLKHMQKQNEQYYHAEVLQRATRRKLSARAVNDSDLFRNRKICKPVRFTE